VSVSETKVRKGKGRGHAGPAAMPRVTRQTSPLTYRGYPVQELCWRHSFEEVAFLLWHGELPTRDQLLAQNRAERSLRAIHQDLGTALAGLPLSADPLETLRKAVSTLGANAPVADDRAPAAVHAEALRLFAVLPSLVAFDQRRRRGLAAVGPRADLGYAANFLYMTLGKLPEPQVVAAFERSLILHAGDSFGISPLAARIGTASVSVLYAAVAAAAGTLTASPHGTAAEAVLGILNEGMVHGHPRSWAEEAAATGLGVAGFVPADAKGVDNRVPAMRTALGMVAALRDGQRLIEAYEALAGAVYAVRGLRPSLDFPTGPAYHLMGFDSPVFAPVLFAARLPGLTAHLAGQPGVNGMIRPRASYDDQRAGHRTGEG
jgi:2-methylcitrate synthase